MGKVFPILGGFGSGRTIEIFDQVVPCALFTFGYFRVSRVFLCISGICGIYGTPDVRICPKGRVIPDISGYPIPNDIQN